MADEEEAGEPSPAAAPDPALNYPRGNRLGNRHPRPTVVIVIAVAVMLAGAFTWQALQPARASFCDITGTSGPVRSDPGEAFEAWWADGGPTAAAGVASAEVEQPVAEPTIEDFERSGDTWEWVFADTKLVKVETRTNQAAGTDGYRVGGVNACTFGTPEELGVTGS